MRLAVTGGAGFIGSNFVRFMLNRYDDLEVVNLDKLTYAGNLENLRDVEDDPRYTFVKGDICDSVVVGEALRGADAVVNFAAETHVDRSISGPQDFIRTDVLGTHTLLEAVRALGVKRYLQISTDEVYGSTESGSFTPCFITCMSRKATSWGKAPSIIENTEAFGGYAKARIPLPALGYREKSAYGEAPDNHNLPA